MWNGEAKGPLVVLYIYLRYLSSTLVLTKVEVDKYSCIATAASDSEVVLALLPRGRRHHRRLRRLVQRRLQQRRLRGRPLRKFWRRLGVLGEAGRAGWGADPRLQRRVDRQHLPWATCVRARPFKFKLSSQVESIAHVKKVSRSVRLLRTGAGGAASLLAVDVFLALLGVLGGFALLVLRL